VCEGSPIPLLRVFDFFLGGSSTRFLWRNLLNFMLCFLGCNNFFLRFDVSQQDMTGAVQIIENRCKLVLV